MKESVSACTFKITSSWLQQDKKHILISYCESRTIKMCHLVHVCHQPRSLPAFALLQSAAPHSVSAQFSCGWTSRLLACKSWFCYAGVSLVYNLWQNCTIQACLCNQNEKKQQFSVFPYLCPTSCNWVTMEAQPHNRKRSMLLEEIHKNINQALDGLSFDGQCSTATFS